MGGVTGHLEYFGADQLQRYAGSYKQLGFLHRSSVTDNQETELVRMIGSGLCEFMCFCYFDTMLGAASS